MREDSITFVDLFCGIGGFRVAAQIAGKERGIFTTCVFSSDIDPDAQNTYGANFGERPVGDITQISTEDIPHHDMLFAGFPCQPFSIIGDLKGFEDARGTLFFDIARILEAKRPKIFILENVKQLRGHNEGRTFRRIMETLEDLDYHVDYRILNALDFGLPQKRERVFIVGFREPQHFIWPKGGVPMKPLSEVLQTDVPDFYYASEKIQNSRQEKRQGKKKYDELTIWHENKGGNISAYPFSCALRAGASYNYLLVNGERRLTEREMLRLQGFPDSYKIVCNYQAMRKLSGNSVAVPVVASVIASVFDAIRNDSSSERKFKYESNGQMSFVLEKDSQEYVISGE